MLKWRELNKGYERQFVCYKYLKSRGRPPRLIVKQCWCLKKNNSRSTLKIHYSSNVHNLKKKKIKQKKINNNNHVFKLWGHQHIGRTLRGAPVHNTDYKLNIVAASRSFMNETKELGLTEFPRKTVVLPTIGRITGRVWQWLVDCSTALLAGCGRSAMWWENFCAADTAWTPGLTTFFPEILFLAGFYIYDRIPYAM